MLSVQRLPTAAVCKAGTQDQTPAAPSLILKVCIWRRLLESGSDGGIWHSFSDA